MAVNLVRNDDHETAAHLLNSSFAQFTSDRNVVQWESQLGHKERELEEATAQLACDAGDVLEYWRLRKAAAGRWTIAAARPRCATRSTASSRDT